ncbi:hypothetical protein HY638_00285 [Candidatus Woesearchaeota archaeon]|nr:hypothetical protein [Candidatus Woesearchaeota archaeon]
MKKKAFLGSEIFTYIMLMLVVSLILILGYKSIGYLKDRSEEIAKQEMINTMSADMKATFSYGSVRESYYDVPEKVSEVCFITWNQPAAMDDAQRKKYPLIYEEWSFSYEKNSPTKNAFLYVDTDDSGGFFLGKGDNSFFVTSPDHFRCIKAIDGRIRLKMTGKGDRVEI